MNIKEEAAKLKADAPKLAATTADERNKALKNIALQLSAHKAEIFDANKKDMENAKALGIQPSVMKRLKFDEAKLQDCLKGINQLIGLEDPIGKVLLARELDEDLKLYRISCPIGVIGVIFEARPDAMIQISSLCLKSGNCAILKGGKETAATNKAIFNVIYKACVEAGMPQGCMLQAELHNEIDELLSCDKYVDLLIPRGSNKFVQYIMNNTKIPVMGHADGICHTYLDKDYDEEKALKIIVDAKTQYTAACNATETLLVDRSVAKVILPKVAKALTESNVKLRGTKEVAEIITCEIMEEDEFATEYLDLIISIKLVDGVEEAVRHINYYGSHHTDCIISENPAAVEYFMQMVDSAGVYNNCSTRFADGFRYGFGAEVGISTGKIHARGPVGLEGLVTYKYKLYGNGNIVGDYASGAKEFHFREL
jgi:glutamate-5-semialdehyde dehydrogenase